MRDRTGELAPPHRLAGCCDSGPRSDPFRALTSNTTRRHRTAVENRLWNCSAASPSGTVFEAFHQAIWLQSPMEGSNNEMVARTKAKDIGIEGPV
jgi:hypothetical protein